MSGSSPRSRSPLSGHSGSESTEGSTTKLNPLTLGAHDSSHSKKSSAKAYVGSWVTAQNEFGRDSIARTAQSSLPTAATPAILLTDMDEDDTVPTELVSAKDKVLISNVGGRRQSLEKRLSPRKVSMLPPSSLTQPILEEPEDSGESEEEDKFYDAVEENAQIPRLKNNKSSAQSLAVEDDLLAGISSRQRAKSYPSQAAGPIPMLELPVRDTIVPTQSEQLQQTTGEPTGLRKFAKVAIMAKKWKKRSADCENEVLENTLESVALRQKKRPFIEVPRALKIDILEDAYPIVQKTYQLYKSYLGPRHKLTLLAEKHLENLALQLEKN